MRITNLPSTCSMAGNCSKKGWARPWGLSTKALAQYGMSVNSFAALPRDGRRVYARHGEYTEDACPSRAGRLHSVVHDETTLTGWVVVRAVTELVSRWRPLSCANLPRPYLSGDLVLRVSPCAEVGSFFLSTADTDPSIRPSTFVEGTSGEGGTHAHGGPSRAGPTSHRPVHVFGRSPVAMIGQGSRTPLECRHCVLIVRT